MNTIHRFYAVLLCLSIALIAACNPVPLSVVASDFSINDIKGTSTSTSTGSSSSVTGTTTGTSTSSSASKSTGATTGTGVAGGTTATTGTTTGTGTSAEQNVTIDLTSKETCSNLTSLVTKVKLDEGVTISPNPAVARDYTSPVTYTVTESYGAKVVYTVTVKGKACDTTRTTTATSTVCKADAISSSGYSLVFKGCNLSNVAEYYDKTECVRENATGLIWQGQTTYGTSALRSSSQLKFNFDDITKLQRTDLSNAGFRVPTQAEVDNENNAIGFKNAVNATNLCGGSNWRLPSTEELINIVKPVVVPANDNPTIDKNWFPNTQPWTYWTSTPDAADDNKAWVINFSSGIAHLSTRDCNNSAVCNFHLVRLVRQP
jgi:Protein of unknown function (DUF1566)